MYLCWWRWIYFGLDRGCNIRFLKLLPLTISSHTHRRKTIAPFFSSRSPLCLSSSQPQCNLQGVKRSEASVNFSGCIGVGFYALILVLTEVAMCTYSKIVNPDRLLTHSQAANYRPFLFITFSAVCVSGSLIATCKVSLKGRGFNQLVDASTVSSISSAGVTPFRQQLH